MEELLNKAKDGDIVAYTEAFIEVRDDLKKLAVSKLTDKSYADDIVQNVYYKAYKNLGRLEDNKKFRSWIFTILRNECINANRYSRAHLESDVDEYEESIEDGSIPSPDSRIAFEDMIKDLTEDERKLLRLKFEEAYTNKEISEKLGIPYNTVKSKILRAVKKITLVLLVLIMVSGFTALAVFVIKQIKAHFTTSLNAINTAVENNYVQEIDSDFVYDNGIGIKVDAIILDDKNLDISFVYDIQDKEKYGEITEIGLKDYVIKSEDGVLFTSQKEAGKTIKTASQKSYGFEIIDEVYRNSILFYSQNDLPKIEKLKIEINHILINNQVFIEGNWNAEYNINDFLNSRKQIGYVMEENHFVEDYKVSLIDTSIIFEINLRIEDDFENIDEITLKNNMDEYTLISYSYVKNIEPLILKFDLGKYDDNTENLILEIPRDNGEIIKLKFRRSQ